MSFLNLLLAFVEGLVLIVSPCILPILPIILSVGLEGGKKRPYGLITGFILSFWIFTLLSRKLVMLLGIDTEILRQASFIFLLLFGLILFSTFLSEKFSTLTQSFADFGQKMTTRSGQQEGFLSGLLVGVFIGLIWSPCVGPIIAAVLVQTIRQTSDLNSALLLGAFSLGVGLPMLLIMLGGKTVLSKLDFFKTRTVLIRKVLGGVIIATVLLTSGGSLFHLPTEGATLKPAPTGPKLVHALNRAYPAPDFKGISAWINTKPLTMAQLKGKVVLIDFWTYSCINCVRTLPYITSWDQKYRNQGLVIVGVHSPEFEFEKKLSNVEMAVKEHHIQYPVALDNNLDTFTNFNNQAWPAHYLIDRNGNVVYTHFGEGEYDVTENNIRALLGVNGKAKADKESAERFSFNQTPETYLGYARTENFRSPEGIQQDRATSYTFPGSLPMNSWALNGNWKIGNQQITAQKPEAALRLHFTAKKVYLVLGPTNGKPVTVTLLLNGKPIENQGGKDVAHSQLVVKEHTLYELVNQDKAKSGLLEIKSNAPGLAAYAFTFG
jgi:cytochrome c biogenesis protein CcdA/thiol-disulfide isomerase/thioredoxin